MIRLPAGAKKRVQGLKGSSAFPGWTEKCEKGVAFVAVIGIRMPVRRGLISILAPLVRKFNACS
jgi:hypothetical protein